MRRTHWRLGDARDWAAAGASASQRFVVVVGFLILAGAVNRRLSLHGVLTRAEDGVMPEWFLKPIIATAQPSPSYVIIACNYSRSSLAEQHYMLGEAYALAVWSFVFKRWQWLCCDSKSQSARVQVPLNLRIRGVEVPFGLIMVFLVLFATAVLNFLTKEVATVGGMAFTIIFLTTFVLSNITREETGAAAHLHLEQFNRRTPRKFDPAILHLSKPYRNWSPSARRRTFHAGAGAF